MWHQTSRHDRGYGTAWTKLRLVILRRDSGLCQVCAAQGIVTRATEVDHIKDKALGGTDAPDNLQSICKPCHIAKGIKAQGKTPKVRLTFDKDGNAVW